MKGVKPGFGAITVQTELLARAGMRLHGHALCESRAVLAVAPAERVDVQRPIGGVEQSVCFETAVGGESDGNIKALLEVKNVVVEEVEIPRSG